MAYYDKRFKVLTGKSIVDCNVKDGQYKDFDTTTAVQTYEVLGKHLYEFMRSEEESIPEIFTLPGSPEDSILEAVFTVSPQMS